jgi:hypothetical protein
MDNCNRENNILYLFGPPAVLENGIINKNKEVIIGENLEDITKGVGNIKQMPYFPAGASLKKVIDKSHHYGNKGKNQKREKNSPLERIGVVFSQIVQKNKDDYQDRTKKSV